MTVWLQFTAGRGPVECRLALAGLLRVLACEAVARELTVEVVGIEAAAESQAHGPASALVAVTGEGAAAFAAGWAGTVQWICPSPVRPHHGRKNWFVGVDLLAPPAAASAVLRETDVAFETLRASGPGGQHVNKTESAVRATHRPTGLVVVAREERSQHRNRALALARLEARLAEQARAAGAAAARDRRDRHDQLARGNPVRVYEGPGFVRRR